MRSALKYICLIFVWLILAVLQFWAAGAIYFCSFPENSTHRGILAIIYLVAVIVFTCSKKEKTKALFICLIGYCLILMWFASIEPDPKAVYPEHLQTSHADFKDNQIIIHNVRNNEFRTSDDFDVHYETRTYNINDLKTVDLIVNYWGMDAIAHALLSFGFADGRYVSVSIGIRPEVGEKYGLFEGFYKQFELIYEWGDERDIIRSRSNYRGEDVYLYRTTLSPKKVQALFLSMLKRTNNLYRNPEFYNTLLESCTNTIGDHLINDNIYAFPFYRRRFLSGDVDHRSYEEGLLESYDLPFDQLRQQSNIVERAKAADQDPNFSNRIRTHIH